LATLKLNALNKKIIKILKQGLVQVNVYEN